MSRVIQDAFNGVSVSAIYMLVGLGITLVFGLTRLVNFAHGQLVMVAALTVVSLVQVRGMPLALAGVIAVLVVVAISAASDRLLFRPTLASPLNGFVVSLGLISILEGLAVMVWSLNTRALVPPFAGVIEIGDITISKQRLFVIAVTVPIMSVFLYFLRFSRTGLALRAVASDPETAGWMGVPVLRTISVTFAVGGAMAAIAGLLFSTLFPVNTEIGGILVVKGFAVALLGGLGSVAGCISAALILGLIEVFVSGYIEPQWQDGFAFAAIIIVLLFKPTGLFRGAEGSDL